MTQNQLIVATVFTLAFAGAFLVILLMIVGMRRLASIFQISKPAEQSTALAVRPPESPSDAPYIKLSPDEFENFCILLHRTQEWADTRLDKVAPVDGGFAWRWNWPGKPGREFETVQLRISHEGMLRVIAGVDIEDPVFLYNCFHRTSPINISVQSLMYARADDPLSIWVFSPQEFTVDNVNAKLRLSPEVIARFREENLRTQGFTSSIPHADSIAGRDFYRNNPDLIP